jgi:hypothetical protein
MKVYNSITEYLKEGKNDDYLVFQGKGILDGFKNITKNDVYKHTCIRSNTSISLRAYRGKRNLGIGIADFDQKVKVLTTKEFGTLTKFY